MIERRRRPMLGLGVPAPVERDEKLARASALAGQLTYSKNATERRQAAEELIAECENQPKLRRRPMITDTKFGETVLPAFINATSDNDKEVRQLAVSGLRSITERCAWYTVESQIVPALIQSLKDSNKNVSFEALKALSNLTENDRVSQEVIDSKIIPALNEARKRTLKSLLWGRHEGYTEELNAAVDTAYACTGKVKTKFSLLNSLRHLERPSWRIEGVSELGAWLKYYAGCIGAVTGTTALIAGTFACIHESLSLGSASAMHGQGVLEPANAYAIGGILLALASFGAIVLTKIYIESKFEERPLFDVDIPERRWIDPAPPGAGGASAQHETYAQGGCGGGDGAGGGGSGG